jgi:glucose-1-phosphate adenylyltransferase
VRVNSFSEIEECVIFENVTIGRYAKLRRCVIDKDVEIPQGLAAGFDKVADAARGFVTTDGGITTIPKGWRQTK